MVLKPGAFFLTSHTAGFRKPQTHISQNCLLGDGFPLTNPLRYGSKSTHHLETMGDHCLLVFTGSRVSGFVRWCEIRISQPSAAWVAHLFFRPPPPNMHVYICSSPQAGGEEGEGGPRPGTYIYIYTHIFSPFFLKKKKQIKQQQTKRCSTSPKQAAPNVVGF